MALHVDAVAVPAPGVADVDPADRHPLAGLEDAVRGGHAPGVPGRARPGTPAPRQPAARSAVAAPRQSYSAWLEPEAEPEADDAADSAEAGTCLHAAATASIAVVA